MAKPSKTTHVVRSSRSGKFIVPGSQSTKRDSVMVRADSLTAATNRAVEQRDVHVVPSEGGWTVRREGASRATRRFQTKEKAIDWARHSAVKDGTDLVVHGRDGRIRSKDSYGADPFPPKAKK